MIYSTEVHFHSSNEKLFEIYSLYTAFKMCIDRGCSEQVSSHCWKEGDIPFNAHPRVAESHLGRPAHLLTRPAPPKSLPGITDKGTRQAAEATKLASKSPPSLLLRHIKQT